MYLTNETNFLLEFHFSKCEIAFMPRCLFILVTVSSKEEEEEEEEEVFSREKISQITIVSLKRETARYQR